MDFNILNNNNLYEILKKILSYDDFLKIMQNIYGDFVCNLLLNKILPTNANLLYNSDSFIFIDKNQLIDNITSNNKYFNCIENTNSMLIHKNPFYLIPFDDNEKLIDIHQMDHEIINYDIFDSHIYNSSNEIVVFYDVKLQNWNLCIKNNINNNNNNIDLTVIYELIKNKNILTDIQMIHYFIYYDKKNKKDNIHNLLLYKNDENNENTNRLFYVMSVNNNNNNLIMNSDLNIYHFSCFDEFKDKLEYISYENKINKRLTTDGFYLRSRKNCYNKIKIITDIYKTIINEISQNFDVYSQINIQHVYLYLYQKNKLNIILPFFTNYYNEIINRINLSIKTISTEIMNLYQNDNICIEQLPQMYQKIINDINKISRYILINDIYYYIKNMSFNDLLELFRDRLKLMKIKCFVNELNIKCIYTIMQIILLK